MILDISEVYKSYNKHFGFFNKKTNNVLKGVSLKLQEGECLGIIGESGSGKSTLGRAILGVEKPDKGSVILCGEDLYKSKNADLRSNLSAVFQDYTSSVNPRFKVFDIIAEPLRNLKKVKDNELKDTVRSLLDKVGLCGECFLERYPHELSGGQLQRVCIARAIACKPKFILLDEAISSLDVSTQVQILDLLVDLKNEFNLSYIFITHDLTAITYICDRVLFFKEGNIVEEISKIEELKNVKHEYSKALLNSVIEFKY